jgi:hypothetical protein
MSKSITAIDYRLRDQFEVLRARLLGATSIPHNKPLAYWALPADRRLPLALLGKSLDELLAMPYADIAATPGIGHKKLGMLITLLGRVFDAAKAATPVATPAPDRTAMQAAMPVVTDGALPPHGAPLATPTGPGSLPNGLPNAGPDANCRSLANDSSVPATTVGALPPHPLPWSEGIDVAAERPVVNAASGSSSRATFDAARVSETQWEKWRETVRRHELEQEMLGSVAQSLRSLPTVIWHNSLAAYLDLSLTELRALRTHGEKRVRAILRVFWEIESVFGSMPRNPDFAVRLIPRNLLQVESWLAAVLAADRAPYSAAASAAVPHPDGAEIRQNLISPILNQLQTDAGDVVAGLAERRLAIDSPALCVSQESNRMGVTRARIYQLLDGCARIMAIRWPRGRWMLDDFSHRLARGPERSPYAAVQALQSLCFPATERAGLEQAQQDRRMSVDDNVSILDGGITSEL